MLLFCCLLAASVDARDRLVYSVWVVRHGDRTPFSHPPFKQLEYRWASYGQLTPEGMQQTRDLGAWYRKRYVEGERLLDARYSAGQISAVSTAKDRTLTTAACLLIGLYPPGTGPRLPDGHPALPDAIQPVPVYSIPDGDKNILTRESEMPEETRLMISATLSGMRLPPDAPLRQDLVRWGDILGGRISTCERLIIAADNLNCMLAHGVPLPPPLTVAEAGRIRDAGFAMQARIYSSPEMMRFSARGFFEKLREDFERRKNGQAGPQVNLYAAHDTTVLAFMAALRAPLPTNPPYAAHIEFDLLQTDGGGLAVEVSYNGQPVLMDGKRRLSLDNFYRFIEPVTRKVHAADDDYDRWLSP